MSKFHLSGFVFTAKFSAYSESNTHLTKESDWLLAHGMGVADVGFDDLSERLLHSL